MRNSEGCTDTTFSEYQRTAPLPKSVPKIGKSATATKAQMNPTTAIRRIRVGDIIDTKSITPSPSTPKATCRVT